MNQSQKLYSELVKKNTGIEPKTAKAVSRLAGYLCEENTLTKAEIAKWKKLNVICEEGLVVIDDPKSLVQWIVMSLIWDGKVERHPVQEAKA